ncbi:hypothetical protein [Pseudoduganella chitinolytica]|uniref:Uncharacterized protein n=1 Tax=Pseudoduganella chitinolytica TaxID=34070 RepID=A0ABY8BJQ1_9BURK|nr:hypothetical protein [Pseudoduganella chitinolytica]WEF34912.1 hypothetical protein PX653_09170 [Pseudoduganella chitinolytica]
MENTNDKKAVQVPVTTYLAPDGVTHWPAYSHEQREEYAEEARKETRDYYEAKIADLFAAQPVAEAAAQAECDCCKDIRQAENDIGWMAAAPTAQPTPSPMAQFLALLEDEQDRRMDEHLPALFEELAARRAAQPAPPDDERAGFEALERYKPVVLMDGTMPTMARDDAEGTWVNIHTLRAALRQPGALPDDAEHAARGEARQQGWKEGMDDAITLTKPIAVERDRMRTALESARLLLANLDGLSKNNICNLAGEEVEKIDRALAAKQAGKEAPCAN